MFIAYTSLQGLWKNKKRTLSILLVFFGLSVALIFASSFKYTERATKLTERQEQFGKWSYANFDGKITDSNDFDDIGTIYNIETINETNFASFSESMFNLSSFKYYSGRPPRNNQEVIVEISSLELLDAHMELNQDIVIKTNSGDNKYRLVGIIYDYSNEWLTNESQTYQYPSVITTDVTTNNFAEFAYSEKLPNLTGEQYVSNSLTYHQIDTESDAAELWSTEDELIKLQSNELVNILLSVSLFVIISIFRISSEFYEKKVLLLRTLGINKFEAFVYNLIHALVFAVAIVVSFFLSLGIFKVLLDMTGIGKFEINNSLFNKSVIILTLSTFFVHLLVSSRSVFKKLAAGTVIPDKNTIRLNRLLPVITTIILSVLLLTTLTPPFFQVIEYHKPRIDEMLVNCENSKHYTIWGNIGEETKLLGKDEINKIKSMEGLKEIIYYNVYNVNLENTTKQSDVYNVEINEYSDEWLDYFRKVELHLSQDFIDGKSVIFSKEYSQLDDYTSISVGDTVLLNDTELYTVENIVDDEILASVVTQNNTNLSVNSIFISEKGIRRIGFDPDFYNVINIRLNSQADPLIFDAELSKLAQGQRLMNQRFYFETELNRRVNDLNFELLQMGALFVIGFGIITNLLLNMIIRRKRDLGMQKLLGFQDSEIIMESQRNYLLPLVLGIVPTFVIGYELYIRQSFKRYLESPIDTDVYINSIDVYRSKMFNLSIDNFTFIYALLFVLAIIFLIILMNFIIIKHFIKKNPFDLIDEKE